MYDVSRLKLLGKGVFSKVYDLDEHSVLKVSTDETDGFSIIHDLSDKVINKYSLPRIDKQRSNPEEGHYVIEKLYPIDPSLFDDTELVMTIFLDLAECPNLKSRFKQYIQPTHPLFDIFCKAEHVFCLLFRYGYPISLDITTTNIMVRRNGELVLSDPFGKLDI